jgi:multiple sugar transport system substrate-binding protein
MIELEFSLLSADPATLHQLQLAMQQFEAEHQIRVNIQPMPWDSGRAQLVDFALFKAGPDVSEIGTTWLGSFAAMSAVRPFTSHEIQAIGGSSVFMNDTWESGLSGGSLYAMPWRMDTRNVYYRRDMLEAAGIAEENAFSLENIVHTLTRLQENGAEIPWANSVRGSADPLHLAAAWVWSSGGRFMSLDGRSVRFTEPEAINGLRRYFQTFLPFQRLPQAQNLTEAMSNSLFLEGKAAATVSGPWLLNWVRTGEAQQIVANNLGMAPAPGIPFIGGSNLVVWNHSPRERAALQLVQFLCSYEVQANHLRVAGQIPARRDALNEPPFTDDPFYHQVYRSLELGQPFRGLYLWGMAEDRLTTAIGAIWRQLLNNPDLDLDKALMRQLKPIAMKLNRVFAS